MSLPSYQYQLMGMAQEARISLREQMKNLYGDKLFSWSEKSVPQFDHQKEISTLREELKHSYKNMIELDSSCFDLKYQCDSLRDTQLKYIIQKQKFLGERNKLWRRFSQEVRKNENLQIEKEKWIESAVKFQYLFEKMKDVGLSQSEDIFECFEDIDVPDVDIHTKNKYVPTELTQNEVSDDEGEDRENIEILDYQNLNTASDNTFMNTFTQLMNISLLDTLFTVHVEQPWYTTRYPTIIERDAIIYIQKIFRGYITRRKIKNIISSRQLFSSYKLGINEHGRLFSTH